MPGRRLIVAGLLSVALLAASLALAPARQAAAASQCFPQTGKCIEGLFLDYWNAHGGLAINGYPLTGEVTQTLEDGHAYTVQYFERVRLEYHPENPAPNNVLLGQFGRLIHPADPPTSQRPGMTFFAPTGHNVAPDFLAYWQANGGLAQFGYPLTEEIQERLDDGRTYTVQYFERARFERHPENAAPYDIELGQFGRRILAAIPPAQLIPAPPPGSAIPVTFSGRGPGIKRMSLPAGLTIFSTAYVGRDNFIVELKDSSLDYVGTVANDIGTTRSSTAFNVPASGSYVFDVEASGSWSILVLHPNEVDFGTATPLPVQVSGTGNQVRYFFMVQQPGIVLTQRYTGSDNFIVDVLDAQGNYVGTGANVIGSATVTSVVQVPSDGIYLLDITANGSWTIDVSQFR